MRAFDGEKRMISSVDRRFVKYARARGMGASEDGKRRTEDGRGTNITETPRREYQVTIAQ